MELHLFRNFKCVFFLLGLLLAGSHGNPSGKPKGIHSVRENVLGKQWTQQKGNVLSIQIEKELAVRLFFSSPKFIFLREICERKIATHLHIVNHSIEVPPFREYTPDQHNLKTTKRSLLLLPQKLQSVEKGTKELAPSLTLEELGSGSYTGGLDVNNLAQIHGLFGQSTQSSGFNTPIWLES